MEVIPEELGWKHVIFLFVLLIAILSTLALAGTYLTGETYSMQEIRSTATNMTAIGYDNFLRNYKSYKEDMIYLKGEIKQVQTKEDGYYFYVATGKRSSYYRGRRLATGYDGDMVLVEFDRDDAGLNMTSDLPVKGQFIEAWGIYKGPHSYQTVSRTSNTVPYIHSLQVNIRDEE